MSSDPQIVDLTQISANFPRLTQPVVDRQNLVDTITTVFERGVDVLTLEGEDGYGRTTLAAQFAAFHHDSALSVFLTSTSKWGYDPVYFRGDLLTQINWLTGHTPPEEDLDPTDVHLRHAFYALQKRAKRHPIYFVIDGLNDIPKQEAHQCRLILETLPFGLQGFKFLLSRDLKDPLPLPPEMKRLASKTFLVPTFTLNDTRQYLSDLVADPTSVEELHALCKGIPGHLASVRRLLQTGEDARRLVTTLHERLPHVFEVEWESVQSHDALQSHALAVLAFDPGPFTPADLARILSTDVSSIQSSIGRLSFISMSADRLSIRFAAESYRAFARTKLHSFRRRVQDLLIDDLLRDPTSNAAVLKLPAYFRETGRADDLLKLISLEYVEAALKQCESTGPLRQAAQLGVETARKMNRDQDLMRLAINNAALEEVAGADIWDVEIKAYLALNEFDLALAVAQAAALREDRLYLLSLVARAKREAGLMPEPELIQQLRQLFSQINKQDLKARRAELADVLVYTLPEAAVELIDDEDGATTAADRDLAMANLSYQASQLRLLDPDSTDTTVDDIRARIANPAMFGLSVAAPVVFGTYSAPDVLTSIEGITSFKLRLSLYRAWCLRNRQRADAIQVTRRAVEDAIQTAEYTPNASDFKDLTAPLPYTADIDTAAHVIRMLDSLRGTFETYGPTVDYVRLDLQIAEVERRHQQDGSTTDRVLDLYSRISDLPDLPIRAECLASLVAFLTRSSLNAALERDHGLPTKAETAFRGVFGALLADTADHQFICRPLVRELAPVRPDLAREVALAMNTEPRRDAALCDAIEAIARSRQMPVDIAAVRDTLSHINLPALRDRAVTALSSRIGDDFHGTGLSLGDVASCLPWVDSIGEPFNRCRSYCSLYAALSSDASATYAGLRNTLKARLDSSLAAIDQVWLKIQAAFEIVSVVAPFSREMATAYLEQANTYKEDAVVQAPNLAWSLIASIRLVIAAAAGLLPRNLLSSDDVERIGDLISLVPSNGERALLWGDLAQRMAIAKRTEDAVSIVSRNVRPLYERLASDNHDYKLSVVVRLAPLLYMTNRTTTTELIAQLHVGEQDGPYDSIMEFVYRKTPMFEPYEAAPRHGGRLSYDELVTLSDVLAHIREDSLCYYWLCKVCDCVVDDKKQLRYTREQRQDIDRRLRALIDTNFPAGRFIAHDGFKIAGQAQLLRLANARREEWDKLALAARGLGNRADRAFVLALIAEAMPSREKALRNALLAEARGDLKDVPSAQDRATRLLTLAEAQTVSDPLTFRDLLREAMRETLGVSGGAIDRVQRRMVDLAHRIDPKFAASLVALADDDPARLLRRQKLREELRILNARKSLSSTEADAKDGTARGNISPDDLQQSAWRALAGMNGDQIPPRPLEELREQIAAAASMPLSNGYPVLAWAIANATSLYSNKDQAERILRPIFEATLLGCQVTGRLVSQSALDGRRAGASGVAILRGGTGILVHEGERDAAVEYIKEWIREHVVEYLTICDPFFGPEELEVLQWVQSAKAGIHVRVLTSQKHQDQLRLVGSIEDEFRTYWSMSLSAIDPPPTEVFVVGTERNHESPIHDRWWLTKGAGLRLGTSVNSLGVGKKSDISVMNEDEVAAREQVADGFLTQRVREHAGERVRYAMFSM
jgi:hypothetical protein